MAINVEISGVYACFSRPELKVERVSYEVITPSAVRGILEAVFWKPAIRYVINEIRVCSPIKFDNIRRNEVKSKASPGRERIYAADDRTQRAAMVLKDVRYVIEARFELTESATADDSPAKHISIAKRRMQKGQTFNQPYLGCREFSANFRLLEDPTAIPESFYKGREAYDLGFMLYDIDYANKRTPMFFRARMENGVVNVRDCEVLT